MRPRLTMRCVRDTLSADSGVASANASLGCMRRPRCGRKFWEVMALAGFLFFMSSVSFPGPRAEEPVDVALQACIREFERSKGRDSLVACVLSIDGVDQLALIGAVTNLDSGVVPRLYLTELLDRVPGSVGTGGALLSGFRQVQAPVLKSALAQALSRYAGAQELKDVEALFQTYDAARQALWGRAGGSPASRAWVDALVARPMWSEAQLRLASSGKVRPGSQEDQEFLGDLVNNFLITFHLHEAVWAIEAKRAAVDLQGMDSAQSRSFYLQNRNSPNRYLRLLLLGSALGSDESDRVEGLWDAEDLRFTKAYLEILRSERACRYFEFIADQLGDLYRALNLKEDAPGLAKGQDGSAQSLGLVAAELGGYFQSYLEVCDDTGAKLVQYLEGHPTYPAKTLLLAALYRVLAEQKQPAVPGSVAARAAALASRLSREESEHPSVRRVADDLRDELSRRHAN